MKFGGGSEVVFEGFVQVAPFCKERSRRVVRLARRKFPSTGPMGLRPRYAWQSVLRQIYTNCPNKLWIS